VERRHSLAEFVEPDLLIFIELVEHPQLLEVVNQQCLKVDIQLDSIVLTAPKDLPVFLDSFLLKDYVSLFLRFRLGLKLRPTIHLLCDIKGRMLFLILV
jgi:hypothetical protein